MRYPLIESSINSYRDTVIGKSNEPITVAGLLDRAKQIIGKEDHLIKPDWSLGNIYDRLEANAPRIAIIGGSPDHPAHIMDYRTIAYASLRIWQNGGVPFQFSTPVMCDGTAQDNQGMSYSLQSRNAVAQMIVNQIEAHSYHGAFVIQGCDKQPLGVVSALAQIDRVRQYRGEAPFFATFAPAHVLSGGTYPDELISTLHAVADKAKLFGDSEIGEDIEDCLSYVLVCSTNTSFQGVLERAERKGIITAEMHKQLEKGLAISTCDGQGGVCAFNGTGNSSRHLVAGLGLAHPALELLTEPPKQVQVNEVLDSLAGMINNPIYSVTNLLATNIRNAIRIHSASGGSTNLLMHVVAGMLYGGFRFSVWDYDRIHHDYPIPDLFDYSLTAGRDIFALARQCCDGESRGMETLFHELLQHGVPMDIDAPTVTATSWKERLKHSDNLPATNVKNNPIIVSEPRRPYSGVDVLKGNFFESAVVKISGLSTKQLDDFDGKLNVVIYFDNEQEANGRLLDPNYTDNLKKSRMIKHQVLKTVLNYNASNHEQAWLELSYNDLFDKMITDGILKLAFIIAGQGPAAFGMPEMYTPMQHINANRSIRRLVTVISDGRYSGVTLGAAVGHMTPEAYEGGGILYLETGDLLYLGLREKHIHYVDAKTPIAEGKLKIDTFNQIKQDRGAMAEERLKQIKQRQRNIAASNRLLGHTDAAHGVVPLPVYEAAEDDYLSKRIFVQSNN